MTCPRSQSLLCGRAGLKNLGDLRPMLTLFSLSNIASAVSLLPLPSHLSLFVYFSCIYLCLHLLSLLLSHFGLLLSRPACWTSFFFHLYFSFGLISVLPGESLQFSRTAPRNLPKAHRCNKTCLFIWRRSGMWDDCLAASQTKARGC